MSDDVFRELEELKRMLDVRAPGMQAKEHNAEAVTAEATRRGTAGQDSASHCGDDAADVDHQYRAAMSGAEVCRRLQRTVLAVNMQPVWNAASVCVIGAMYPWHAH